MNDFTWGAVPKAQDDPQLITEAITAAIAAHNNDPDAHLGDGQSLQSHRASEIIDHIAGSVKNDKSSFSTFFYDLKYSDYASWTKYKSGSAYSFFQQLTEIQFESDPSGAAGYNRVYKHFSNSPSILSSYFISATVLSENTPHSSQYWGFGIFDSTLAKDRMAGFKYKSGHLYASLFNFSTATSIDFELTGLNIFDNTEHNLRMYYDVTLNTYSWYIDGSLVYTYDNSANSFPSPKLPAAGGFDFDFTYNSSYDFVLHCYDYVMSVDSTY